MILLIMCLGVCDTNWVHNNIVVMCLLYGATYEVHNSPNWAKPCVHNDEHIHNALASFGWFCSLWCLLCYFYLWTLWCRSMKTYFTWLSCDDFWQISCVDDVSLCTSDCDLSWTSCSRVDDPGLWFCFNHCFTAFHGHAEWGGTGAPHHCAPGGPVWSHSSHILHAHVAGCRL